MTFPSPPPDDPYRQPTGQTYGSPSYQPPPPTTPAGPPQGRHAAVPPTEPGVPPPTSYGGATSGHAAVPPAGHPGPGNPTPPSPPKPIRLGLPLPSLTAWALLALAATIIVFELISWLFPGSPRGFFDRFSVGGFTNVTMLVAPLLAVLVATKLGQVIPQARLVGLIAVTEYGVALVAGLLAFVLTLIPRFTGMGTGLYAFGGLLGSFGGLVYDLIRLALLALAGMWTLRLYNQLGGRIPKLDLRAD